MDITFLDACKNLQEEDDWYRNCRKNNIPCVLVRRRTALGDVEWDYISIQQPEDEEFYRTQTKFIEHELEELVKSYSCKKTIKNIGSYTGYVKNLPLENLSDFATDVCNTLAEAHKKHEQDRLA